MKILLTKKSKRYLAEFLKFKYNVASLVELSRALSVSKGTLNDWFYEPKRYIPSKIIPSEVFNKLEISDRKEDNWGNIKGKERRPTK